MSRVFMHGLGAVSPAGWGVTALRAALAQGEPLPVQSLVRPGWAQPLRARLVPAPPVRPAFLAHPRLRRASPMTHYTVAAALEALGGDAALVGEGRLRLGIVTATMTGGISYSRRFYEEVLQNPTTASPMIFPETVFNSAASHLAAFLGATGVNDTLVGDAGSYLQGLAVAAAWLESGVADACLVIGAEETDWTAADALRLFDRWAVHACGAGALYLKAEPASALVELTAVTDCVLPGGLNEATEAARQVRAQLPGGSPDDLLCARQPEDPAWCDWPGKVMAPGNILGEAFVASTAWQCVAAADAVRTGAHRHASVSVTGAMISSIGAHFSEARPPVP